MVPFTEQVLLVVTSAVALGSLRTGEQLGSD